MSCSRYNIFALGKLIEQVMAVKKKNRWEYKNVANNKKVYQGAGMYGMFMFIYSFFQSGCDIVIETTHLVYGFV